MGAPMNLPGKLVRDRIPEIIRAAGLIPVTEVASPENHGDYIRAKLREELEEYLGSGDVAELVDLFEVCHAAARFHGAGPLQLTMMARDKRATRGGFDQYIIWMGNLQPEPSGGS